MLQVPVLGALVDSRKLVPFRAEIPPLRLLSVAPAVIVIFLVAGSYASYRGNLTRVSSRSRYLEVSKGVDNLCGQV